MIVLFHSYANTTSGPSWVQRNGPQQVGESSDIRTTRWRYPRTGNIWPLTLQNETQMLLEVPGSLHTHPNGITHQLPATTTILKIIGFLSYPLDRLPGQVGTLGHHSTIPYTRLLTHHKYHLAVSGLSRKHRPQRHLRLSHGVQLARRAFLRLAHQPVSTTGNILLLVRALTCIY